MKLTINAIVWALWQGVFGLGTDNTTGALVATIGNMWIELRDEDGNNIYSNVDDYCWQVPAEQTAARILATMARLLQSDDHEDAVLYQDIVDTLSARVVPEDSAQFLVIREWNKSEPYAMDVAYTVFGLFATRDAAEAAVDQYLDDNGIIPGQSFKTYPLMSGRQTLRYEPCIAHDVYIE